MKNLYIIANWKSNKNLAEALQWVSLVGPKLQKKENIKVVVCPQFDQLEEVKKAVMGGGYPLMVGAQDLSPFAPGAYTGEESAESLKQFIDLVILGHSERRKNFGETDEMVAKKVERAKEVGIIPLVCVQGKETPVPEGCQLIAYEPIFAIGTGHPDTPADAQGVSASFKQNNSNLEVLYGGSVKSDNCKAFIEQDAISGLLIGGASLDAEEFLKIVVIASDLTLA